jgi:hypothetical protein
MREQENQNGAIAEWDTAIRHRPNYPEMQSVLGKALEAKKQIRAMNSACGGT